MGVRNNYTILGTYGVACVCAIATAMALHMSGVAPGRTNAQYVFENSTPPECEMAQNLTRMLTGEISVLRERAAIASRLMLLRKGDGFGTHVLALMNALAYCRYHNLTYVHWPWDHVGHNPPGQSIAEWSKDLEQFIGVVQGEVVFSQDLGPVPVVQGVRLQRDVPIASYFSEPFLATMRTRYMSTANKTSPYVSRHGVVNVAVHIRRGDVLSSMPARFTNISQTLAHMQRVENDLQKRGAAVFHVFSEGSPADFYAIVERYKERVILRLNEDIRASFHAMVSADALILAKSGFGYSAALLSKGAIYYQPFWHVPLPSWTLLT